MLPQKGYFKALAINARGDRHEIHLVQQGRYLARSGYPALVD
jgi:hypothetical protein